MNTFEAHENYIEAIKVNKSKSLYDIKTVCYTASRDKTIKIWNFMTGNLLLEFKGHENWVKGLALIEDFDYLISIGEDKTIRIWDLIKKK